MRSNMFANIENKFKFASKDEITATAIDSASKLIKPLYNPSNPTTFVMTLIVGAKLGAFGDEIINDEEKELIDAVFGNLFGNAMDSIYLGIKTKIEDRDYNVVEAVTKGGYEVSMAYLGFILSFAYIDGSFEDSVAEHLDNIFGMTLLTDFIMSGKQQVPTPEIEITKLQAELIDWFKSERSNRVLIPFDDVAKHFPNYPRDEVKNAMDDLLQIGIMNGGDNVINCMYSLEDENIQYTLIRNSLDDSTVSTSEYHADTKLACENKCDNHKSTVDNTSLEQVFAARKEERKVQKERDAKGKGLADKIHSEFLRMDRDYNKRVKSQARVTENGGYDGVWDPRLRRDLQVFGEIINDYGSKAECLIKSSLNDYSEMKDSLSAEVALSIIEAIEEVIDDVSDSSINNDNLGLNYTYSWGMNVRSIKSSLKSEKANLKALAEKQKAELKRQKNEEADYNEAKKYGVSVSDLSVHKQYLECIEKMQKADSSNDFNSVVDSFSKVKSYKDSEHLMNECKAKAAAIREWELSCEKIKTERAQLVEKWTAELKEKNIGEVADLEQIQLTEMSDHKKKQKELAEKSMQIQKELDAAGLFAFSKKKELKAKLIEAHNAEAEASREESALLARHDMEKKVLQGKLTVAIANLPEKAEKTLPMPDRASVVTEAENGK